MTAAEILAALDRLEETARAAVWHDRARNYSVFSYLIKPDAAHVAANDPARVLALVAGIRAVVELHSGDNDCGFACRNSEWGCPTLSALASVFAPAPDTEAGA